MKKIDLGQTISIVANLGVVAGLIFVGLQMQQEKEIAQAERIQLNSAGYREWAVLVTDNAGLWAKGLAGELLSAEEELAFHELARSREGMHFTAWRSAILTGQDELAESIVREQAVEISSHPGFVEWWHGHTELMNAIGRTPEYNDMVDAEMRRIRQGESASSR